MIALVTDQLLNTGPVFFGPLLFNINITDILY